LLIAVLAVAACAKSSGEPPEPEPPAAPVTCAPAVRQSIPSTVVIRGTVAPPPKADSVLSSTIAGKVTEVSVEVGDVVKAGQIVARVDNPELAAGSMAGKADIAAAQAEVIAAQSAKKRMDQMASKGVVSGQEVEDATARLATAQANLAAARARAGGASGMAARAELRSQRAGTVLRIFRRAGEAVDGTPTTPVLEIADVSTLEVRADATAADLVKLAQGATAAITFDAVPDVTATGKVVIVAPAVDPTTALGQVRIALVIDDSKRLVVGLTATATVTLAAHDAVVVPKTALRRGLSGADEVVVCEGSPAKAAVKEVTVGTRTDEIAEIVEGLEAGEKVVVDHALGIEDDQPLDDGGGAGEGSGKGSGEGSGKGSGKDED
jgi:macrolide-specific efflux system membrane fusion protein